MVALRFNCYRKRSTIFRLLYCITTRYDVWCLFKIWIVIGLVIIGTYAFFVGISEIIISILQQVSKVYYHPRYFFVVFGMRVRLKMNAVSLATITLLCTFLIVTLTMTLTTYRDMNHTITKLITNDYDLSFSDNSKSQIERQQTIENIKRDIQGSVNAKDFKVYETTLFRASLERIVLITS